MNQLDGGCKYCGFKLWYEAARNELIRCMKMSFSSHFILDESTTIEKIDEMIHLEARRLDDNARIKNNENQK